MSQHYLILQQTVNRHSQTASERYQHIIEKHKRLLTERSTISALCFAGVLLQKYICSLQRTFEAEALVVGYKMKNLKNQITKFMFFKLRRRIPKKEISNSKPNLKINKQK